MRKEGVYCVSSFPLSCAIGCHVGRTVSSIHQPNFCVRHSNNRSIIRSVSQAPRIRYFAVRHIAHTTLLFNTAIRKADRRRPWFTRQPLLCFTSCTLHSSALHAKIWRPTGTNIRYRYQHHCQFN